MTIDPCPQWSGALALLALDSLDDEERTGVLAHVDGCTGCAIALRELRDVAGSLRHLDATTLAPTASVPPTLASSVLGELRDNARQVRRRHHAILTSIAAALVAIVSLTTWLAVSPSPQSTPTRTVHLRGAGGAIATALLVARAWGTSITLTEHGLAPGQDYDVSLRASGGAWWSAGTYEAVAGRTVTAELSCAVPMREVAGVEIVDAAGRPVLVGGMVGQLRWPPPSAD
jgi:hypothetical protein